MASNTTGKHVKTDRPHKMVGYEYYWSVIRLKQTANRGRLCKLVVFNTYNRPWWWSVICFCILRNIVPHYDTCHHVEMGVTSPRQQRTVKPTTDCGRLCPSWPDKTDLCHTFTHSGLCAVGYDMVGFSPVRSLFV